MKYHDGQAAPAPLNCEVQYCTVLYSYSTGLYRMCRAAPQVVNSASGAAKDEEIVEEIGRLSAAAAAAPAS